MLKLIQFYFSFLSKIAPKYAAKKAFHFFQTVRKKTIRKREQPFYEQATPFKFKHNNEIIDAYKFGKPSKDIVILIHGWDSNAGCMFGFVDEILKMNKQIYSFNLPAHGFHKSKTTNLFHSKNVLKTFLLQLPEFESLSVVSHSFGSALTAYALSEIDIKANQLVFLTSPNHIIEIFDDYKKLIHLSDKSYKNLIELTEKILGEPLKDLSVQSKLKQAQFNFLHLIHDRYDKIIPFKNSKEINEEITNSKIYVFEKIGHYRMLWNEEVINQTLKCLSNN